MTKKKICNLSQLQNKDYIRFWVDDFKDEIIIFINNNKIYVKSSICPHFGGPIVYDKVNNYLFCYWHGLRFTTNGKCINQKDFKPCLNSYNYELRDNSIYIIKNANT